MLTVFRSNRAELLAELLATQLRLAPPGPFEQVQVVVNTWPTSRWLGEQLAMGLGGIAANIRFPFPGSQLRRIVKGLVEGEAPREGSPQNDPWRASQLVWPVLELLPELVQQPEAQLLKSWLAEHSMGNRLELAHWQLGRAIADAFDDYALYRPDLLAAWWQDKPVDSRGQPLTSAQLWQPLLLAALRDRLGEEPFGLKVQAAIRQLRQGPPPAGTLPSHVRLFGLSSMAPIQVQLLQAMSAHTQIDLYLLTTSPDLWQRCTTRRERLSSAVALQEPFAGDWFMEAPGLEARFGRLGGEFQQLLEGTGESLLGQAQDRDLFFAAATSHPGPGPVPLLAQLQQRLAQGDGAMALERSPGDSSLEFHPCPGHLRQVQIVRDRILQWLAADPSLEPRDILVMTPQVDAFAPLVASVFGDSEATGVYLPWRLTDRSQQSEAGISRSLLQLLQLAGERLTASSLETLLDSEALQEHFQLSDHEIAQLHGVLQRCGFRWGLDSRERGGDGTGSLGWAIDRLLLGLVLPEIPGLAPGDTAPLATGHGLDLVGRWVHLLTTLRNWLDALRRSRSCSAWAETLPTLLWDFFGDGGDRAWEVPVILAAIDDWQQAASDCSLVLEAAVVAAVLDERLAVDSGRFGHRSGAITISALEPMRAIPHRVIVLMGLDAGQFPRQRQRSGFHLMEHHRCLGDPQPADQDRYVLMEALLSARDHLMVSWSSRDGRKGEALPPATPVRQWLEWLEGALPCGGADLVVQHPANPLDRANFEPIGERPPGSCDRRLLEARQWLETAHLSKPLPLASRGQAIATMAAPDAPEDPYTDLRDWLVNPQSQWLEQLGLRPKEWAELLRDLDSLSLDERQRSQLLRQALDGAHGENASANEKDDSGFQGDPASWLNQYRGQGLLPPLAAGRLEAITLAQRWQSLHSSLASLGEPKQLVVRWGPWQCELEQRGSSVVFLHTAQARSRHHMELWLQLLVASASGLTPSQGVLVARGEKGFSCVLHLNSPSAEAAQAEIERLAQLRQTWREQCWPLPPQTGWIYAEAEQRKPGSGLAKAIAGWEGGIGRRGEREDPEQSLCFGSAMAGPELLTPSALALATELYAPLLEHQQ